MFTLWILTNSHKKYRLLCNCWKFIINNNISFQSDIRYLRHHASATKIATSCCKLLHIKRNNNCYKQTNNWNCNNNWQLGLHYDYNLLRSQTTCTGGMHLLCKVICIFAMVVHFSNETCWALQIIDVMTRILAYTFVYIWDHCRKLVFHTTKW